MSWIKLCETKKSLQAYHAEDLSKTHFVSRKPDLANQSAASSQKTKRLKLLKNQRIVFIGSAYERNIFNRLHIILVELTSQVLYFLMII